MRRRIPRERERWLSAVLIVTAIVGVSAAVRFWPVSLPPSVPRPLASRVLHAIEAPVAPISGRVLLETAEFVEATSSPAPLEIPAVIELPAVAVTRVVTVAGRGIWTGVRATTAVFRAVF